MTVVSAGPFDRILPSFTFANLLGRVEANIVGADRCCAWWRVQRARCGTAA